MLCLSVSGSSSSWCAIEYGWMLQIMISINLKNAIFRRTYSTHIYLIGVPHSRDNQQCMALSYFIHTFGNWYHLRVPSIVHCDLAFDINELSTQNWTYFHNITRFQISLETIFFLLEWYAENRSKPGEKYWLRSNNNNSICNERKKILSNKIWERPKQKCMTKVSRWFCVWKEDKKKTGKMCDFANFINIVFSIQQFWYFMVDWSVKQS